ncbi:hypothetical protein [Pseudonocardia sp. HH130630-07]|uniref:hypothetical protein n=1 Tax=Pseudonocardia sp. HH130630-07 TaxID=1690815 RepID=UPI0008150B5B|nr:hypothetical protein [Pseudonocardia sp. HH130630-07]ANY07428.1 hypothetical protein AFB00_15270 [Pseudonocardia sp. HH130630-07]
MAREWSGSADTDLLRRGVVAVDSAVDGLRHYVHERHHSAALAARVRDGFPALCGASVVAESLCAAPRPVCPPCRAAVRVAAAPRPSARRPGRWVWSRYRSVT